MLEGSDFRLQALGHRREGVSATRNDSSSTCFRFSGFGFSGLGFRFSVFWFRVSETGFGEEDSGFRGLRFEFRVSGVRLQVSVLGFRI